ncbi:hypothetical protein EDD86DRAFT_202435 [Gorgonomyces haynaldii]|nr:hypothetical protein EDD86DRAFT_202435 [Gorgonomyces haynaldii]
MTKFTLVLDLVDTATQLAGVQVKERDILASCLQQQEHGEETPVLPPDASHEDKLKYLMDILDWLGSQEVRDWILDSGIAPGDDLDEFVPELLFHKLNPPKVMFLRFCAIIAYALGLQWQSINQKHSYHMFACAIHIYERIVRTSRTLEFSNDLIMSRTIYTHLLEYTIEHHSYDSAIEYGSKLVALHDAHDDILDLKNLYDTLTLLGKAALALNDRAILVNSLSRRLEILRQNDVLPEPQQIVDQSLETQLMLCKEILKHNEHRGDALLSVTHGQLAINLDKRLFGESEVPQNELPPKISKTTIDPEARFELLFLTGKAFYKYCLQLAGGIENASSPPIAVMKVQNMPSIKALLENAALYLDDALVWISHLKSENMTPRTLAIQRAVIDVELREEENAKKLLLEHNVYPSVLSSLSKKDCPPDLSPVLCSPEAVKRLLSLAPQPLIKERIVLHRRSTAMGSRRPPIQCSYCLMSVREPIHCDNCSTVFYCTEECKQDHREQHELDCSKGENGWTQTVKENLSTVAEAIPFFN